jgi:DNA polymerase III subunit epsilon
MRLPLRRVPASPAAAAYARAALPPGRTPWRNAQFCAVDLELTGLDPDHDEIISFGAVPIEGGRVRAGRAVYGVARPTRPLPEASILVHGIRPADLIDAPPLDEAIAALLTVIAGHVPVVHVAAVERAFLGPALRRQGVRLREPLVDTNVLGRVWLYERDGDAPARLSLSGLAAALELPAHRPHHAMGDALTTAQVFMALATHLDAIGAETVRSLARAGERLQSHLLYTHRRQ